jgi:hypothetical protein
LHPRPRSAFRMITRLVRPSPPFMVRSNLLLRRALCKAAAENTTSAAESTARAAAAGHQVGRWSLRLAHDNTFLSYHRNAIIATVAGASLIQFRGQNRPPLAGACLLTMGGMYMYVGSGLYMYQVWKLTTPLRLGRWTVFWALFNAVWPTALWTLALSCMLEETPTLLLEGLRLVEHKLPSMLHNTLFFEPPALYPVCILLRAVVTHEEVRLKYVRARAARSNDEHRIIDPRIEKAGPLSHTDIATIIAKRIERLNALQDRLDLLARSKASVPTSLAAPLLERLNTEVCLSMHCPHKSYLIAPLIAALSCSAIVSRLESLLESRRVRWRCLRECSRWTRRIPLY